MNKIGRTKEIPRIIVPQGAQKHIASHFGVSGETVRRALKYIINTELAVRIREEAIKNLWWCRIHYQSENINIQGL